jgi:hypothetical protein
MAYPTAFRRLVYQAHKARRAVCLEKFAGRRRDQLGLLDEGGVATSQRVSGGVCSSKKCRRVPRWRYGLGRPDHWCHA